MEIKAETMRELGTVVSTSIQRSGSIKTFQAKSLNGSRTQDSDKRRRGGLRVDINGACCLGTTRGMAD